MHVTEYEQMDLQHKFDLMLELAERDPMWVAWIKMSRLTLGPWRIEAHEPFQERWGKYVTDYENIDLMHFNAKLQEWLGISIATLASPGAASS